MDDADVVVTEDIYIPRIHVASIETCGCVASYDKVSSETTRHAEAGDGCRDLVGRDRPAEEVALGLGATEGEDALRLVGGLDAFGDRLQVER